MIVFTDILLILKSQENNYLKPCRIVIVKNLRVANTNFETYYILYKI